MTQTVFVRKILKPVVFLLCLLPISLLAYDFFTDNLSANPLDDITDTTGTWTLRFIVITLCVTPVRRLTKWAPAGKFRRLLGLYAFFYGSLHFMTYLYFDKFFEWEEILPDIPKRPFITVGFASLVLMIPLALTSTDRITKWMGGKKWNALHRLIYVTAIGGVIHYLWLVKADTSRPLTYGAIVAVLLGYRLWVYLAPKIASLRMKQKSVSPQTERGQLAP
ncbi:MAG: sulfoxide reductase heme-binding subunit YedZ [Ignavibacteriales bacterium]|nr:sulfoxide reductase heme-binding subunit YedZ [Ignavibacteriales bacterium]